MLVLKTNERILNRLNVIMIYNFLNWISPQKNL